MITLWDERPGAFWCLRPVPADYSGPPVTVTFWGLHPTYHPINKTPDPSPLPAMVAKRLHVRCNGRDAFALKADLAGCGAHENPDPCIVSFDNDARPQCLIADSSTPQSSRGAA
jgi:hypothetical protein